MYDEPDLQPRGSFGLQLALLAERRGRYVVLGGLLGLALGFGVAQVVTPVYVSQAKLLFEPAEVPSEYVRTTVQERGTEELQVLRERITRDEILGGVIARVGTERLDPDGTMSGRALALEIRDRLGLRAENASRSRNAQVIEISYAAREAQLATDVLRELIAGFTSDEAAGRTNQANATAGFLAHELTRAGTELAALEEELVAIRSTLPRELWYRDRAPQGDPESDALVRLTAELARAEATYTSEHPSVRSLRAQIAVLRRRIRTATGSHGEELARYDALQREHARTQESYDKLLARHLEASIAANLERDRADSRFQELQAPFVPKRPQFPDARLLSAAGGLAGAGLVLGVLLAGAWLRPRFGNLEALEDATKLPVMASIPRLEPKRILSEPPPPGLEPRVVAASAPESNAAEQYRSFIPLYLDRKQPGVVLITSSMRGDGKSLTCANLAATTARELGHEVLLIDADLRRPKAHTLFGCRRRPGLADVLAGQAELEDCVQSTPVPGLSLLAAGQIRSVRAARFAEASFTAALEIARSRYATVFLDAPPLLPVVDARLLQRVSEMTLLVVRADGTPCAAVARCLESLGDVAGVVFNDVSTGAYRHSYYDDPYRPYGASDD